MTAVNPKLPMELSDGTPVTNLNHGYPGALREQFIYVSCADGKSREFSLATGKNRYPGSVQLHGSCGRTLRNVAVVLLDTSKPLQTVDGKRVSFIGKMEDGRIVVSVTYSSWGQGPATELRFADGRKSSRPGETSGDDVIVKITEKVVYQNGYADGTTGSTQHASAEAAAQRSKYGKVRIGILKTTLRDGVRFSAVVTPATVPWYRDASVSSGRAATPEDFAR